MKKRWVLLVSVFLGVIIVNSVSAETYVWKRYDDFNSGVINPDKWIMDNSSALISIENGRAKFEHQPGHANDSSWLKVAKKLSKVAGIKAIVTFDSCVFSGDPDLKDVKARISTWIGKEIQNPDYAHWGEIGIEPYFNNGDSPHLYAYTSRNDIPQGTVWIDTLFWGRFSDVNGGVPEDVMGIPYVFSMEWTLSVPQSVTFAMKGLGKIKYNWEKTLNVTKITDPADTFLGIGTRSDSGAGVCTVYFDDVYLKYIQ